MPKNEQDLQKSSPNLDTGTHPNHSSARTVFAKAKENIKTPQGQETLGMDVFPPYFQTPTLGLTLVDADRT